MRKARLWPRLGSRQLSSLFGGNEPTASFAPERECVYDLDVATSLQIAKPTMWRCLVCAFKTRVDTEAVRHAVDRGHSMRGQEGQSVSKR